MAKDRALTLEALRVMDAIDRRGSFAAAADELGRVPSALSYTMQKLEEELDVVLFDRSGHRTKFTNVGRMLLERGRVLLEAADKLTTDAEALARGWETHLTIVVEALVPTYQLFPLVEKLAAKANTQISLMTEVLAGAWERLEQGRADIVIAPDMHFRASTEINTRKLYSMLSVYVASPDHPIHLEPEPLSEVTRVKYRGIAVADTARDRPVLTVTLLDKQQRLTVSSIEEKRQALLAGLGVATMPYPLVEQDIAEGRLRVVSPEYTREVDIIMAWRRDSMGEAKSWCLREIPRLLAKKAKKRRRLAPVYQRKRVSRPWGSSQFSSGPTEITPAGLMVLWLR
ncbi:LysR family transcriptional regulator [Duffyella gerundensis]|uniref:LysR family transcriptional regulator n=1 Tax=Duffyella gerundensis TaxID=1619313 RepID=UPI0021F736E5|nr:LysR family transcriptional regulator [Duffyella gerundensis]